MVRRKAKATTGLTNPKSKVNLTLSPEARDAMDNISKKMGLTRSALIEKLLEGSLSLSSHSLEENISPNAQEDKSTVLTQEIEEYQQKISLLEKELEQQKNLLQKQQEINSSLQQELDKKIGQIKTLESQVQDSHNTPTQDDSTVKIAQLQQLIQEKGSAIASLEQKISHLEQELNTRDKSETKAQEEHHLIQQLKNQLEEKNQLIKTLENRINQTVSKQYISPQLTAINEQQKQTIIHLEKRISELETVASIGQQTLNKWRSRVF